MDKQTYDCIDNMEVIHVILTLFSVIFLAGISSYPYFSNNDNDVDEPSTSSIVDLHHINEKIAARYKTNSKHDVRKRITASCGTILDSVYCTACEVAVEGMKELAKRKSTQADVVYFAAKICILFSIEDTRVCNSITEEFKVNITFKYLTIFTHMMCIMIFELSNTI